MPLSRKTREGAFAASLAGRERRGSAFTLTELLVTILIIALVAAWLMPLLDRAKNQSAKAADLNNLHQILAAAHLYAGDYKESLPWPNWDYGGAMPDHTARAGWLYTPDLAAEGTNVFDSRTSLLWDALRAGKLLLCPLDRPDQPYYSSDGQLSYRHQQLSSYIMNGAVIGFRSGFHSNAPAVKITRMLPADSLLFEGDDREAFSFNDGSSWPTEGISLRHLNGGVLASIDGSSGYVRGGAWASEVQYPGKNRLWCYPETADGGDPIYGHNR